MKFQILNPKFDSDSAEPICPIWLQDDRGDDGLELCIRNGVEATQIIIVFNKHLEYTIIPFHTGGLPIKQDKDGKLMEWKEEKGMKS